MDYVLRVDYWTSLLAKTVTVTEELCPSRFGFLDLSCFFTGGRAKCQFRLDPNRRRDSPLFKPKQCRSLMALSGLRPGPELTSFRPTKTLLAAVAPMPSMTGMDGKRSESFVDSRSDHLPRGSRASRSFKVKVCSSSSSSSSPTYREIEVSTVLESPAPALSNKTFSTISAHPW